MQRKKSLGQHFLRSKGAIKAIIDSSKLNPGDTVLEIGPGEGILTEELVKFSKKVIAIEKDHRLIPILKEKFKNEITEGKLELIEGDILESKLNLSSFKVIANIPYYITGQIFRMFLETGHQPESMTLLIQKEVAEKIVARDKKESLLSLSVKAYGIPKIVKIVPRGSFVPPPNVDSAILHISDISRKNFENTDEKTFFKILHAGFSHKRKVLLSNLSNSYPKEKIMQIFEKIRLNPKTRAEDLPLEKWLELSSELA